VLNVVRGLGKAEFTLGDAYAYAEHLARLHPQNRNVEPLHHPVVPPPGHSRPLVIAVPRSFPPPGHSRPLVIPAEAGIQRAGSSGNPEGRLQRESTL